MPRRSLAALAVLTAVLAPVPAQAAPLFGDATASLFPPAPCEGSGCYTSALVIADLDADGRVDVLFANGGGYYEPGQAEPSVVYFGGDGGLSDGSAAFGSPSSRLRQVAVGDVDGDGDLDVYQPSGYGLDLDRLFIQTAPRVFVEQAAERLPAGLKSRAGAAHLGDLDDDGDLDLVVTDWGTSPLTSAGGLHLFLNDGQGYFSRLDGQLPPSLPASEGTTPIDVDLHDVDGDLDLDILVDHRNGQSRLLLNDGAARFTEAPFPPKKGPYAYNTEACDIDGDGDLDVLLDNAAGDLPGGKHRTQILVNDGHGVFTDETAARVDGEPNSDDNIVKCADLDDDGDFDLIVGSLSNPTEKVLRNDGQGHFTLVDGAFPATSDPTLGLDVADLDGDGRLDVVTGQGEGSPRLDRVFVGLPDAPVDSRPPVFRQVEALPATLPAGQPVRLRLAVSDGYTSEVGQHATVVVDYATQDSSGQVTARFVGGDLFRADLGVFPGGTQLTLTPRATDRRGHAASAPPLAVTVTGGGEGGASGSSGQGGEGGAGAGGAGGACEAGRAECDGDPSTVCEADLTHIKTCGSCGNACATPAGADATCAKGACAWQCQPGRGDCDGKADNGCEADLGEPAHCGSCGQTCKDTNGTPSCATGKCEIACAPGFALCGGAPAQGCLVDLNTDPKNCGSCGHDCQGDACEGGLCASTTVSSGNTRPSQLLLDSTHLYWINLGDLMDANTQSPYHVNGQVRRINTASQAVEDVVTGTPWSYILSQHGGFLYVMNLGHRDKDFKDGEIWRYSKPSLDGGALLRPQVQSGLGMATGPEGLFFVECWLENVFRRTHDGTTFGDEKELRGNEKNASSVAVVGGKLYWVRLNDLGGANAVIRRGDLAADNKSVSNLKDLATGESLPDRMWADGDSIYYVNLGASGRVRRIDHASGKVSTVAEGLSEPQYVTADATHIYWTECGATPRVMRADKETLTPSVVAQGDCAYGVAVDDTWVYYSALAKGEIRRVAR